MKRWPVAFVGILAAMMMASAFGGCAFSDLKDDSVYILHYIVDALQEEFGFNRLYLTAHSMGGLVRRGAILVNRYRYNRDYIKSDSGHGASHPQIH